MSDFFLDFRSEQHRNLTKVADQLKFSSDLQKTMLNKKDFGLVVTQNGDQTLWAPSYASNGSFVLIAGRPAFDESEWKMAEKVEIKGGLAARIVHNRYQKQGISGIGGISGSWAIILFDNNQKTLYLVTDCCGAFPCGSTYRA